MSPCELSLAEARRTRAEERNVSMFIAGTLFGFSLCAAIVTVYVFRDDFRELPRVWREEPDVNLRRWLVVLRRLLSPAPRPPRES